MISAQRLPFNLSFCQLGEVKSNLKWTKLLLLKQASEETTSDVVIFDRNPISIFTSLEGFGVIFPEIFAKEGDIWIHLNVIIPH